MLMAVDWIMVQRRRTMHDENGEEGAALGPHAAVGSARLAVGQRDIQRHVLHLRDDRGREDASRDRASAGGGDRGGTRGLPRVPQGALHGGARQGEAAAARRRDDDPLCAARRDGADWKSIDWTYTSYGPLRAGAWGAIDPNDELMDQTLAFIEAGDARGRDERRHKHADRQGRRSTWRTGGSVFRGDGGATSGGTTSSTNSCGRSAADLFLQRDDLTRFFEWFFNAYAAHIDKDLPISAESLNGAPGVHAGRGGAVDGAPEDVRERARRLRRLAAVALALPGDAAVLADGRAEARRVGGWGRTFGGTVDLRSKWRRAATRAPATAKLALATLPTEIRMRLRSPDGKPLKTATVNGKAVEVLPDDTIRLPLRKAGKYSITGSW